MPPTPLPPIVNNFQNQSKTMKKPLAIGFGILFVLFAILQYNDPDPEVWVPIYALAALACFMALTRFGKVWFYALLAVGYLVAAVLQWPPVFEGFVLNEMGMKTVNIELAREAGGLALCALAMGLMAYAVVQPNKTTKPR
jgi:Transmembrane family 220, helix